MFFAYGDALTIAQPRRHAVTRHRDFEQIARSQHLRHVGEYRIGIATRFALFDPALRFVHLSHRLEKRPEMPPHRWSGPTTTQGLMLSARTSRNPALCLPRGKSLSPATLRREKPGCAFGPGDNCTKSGKRRVYSAWTGLNSRILRKTGPPPTPYHRVEPGEPIDQGQHELQTSSWEQPDGVIRSGARSIPLERAVSMNYKLVAGNSLTALSAVVLAASLWNAPSA